MNESRDIGAVYRVATLSCPLLGDGCPTPDDLQALARGSLPASRRDALLAIVGNCARCAALVQVAGDLDPEQPPVMRELPRPVWQRHGRWLSAASLTVVVLAVALPMWLATPSPRVMRGDDARVQPLDGAELAEAPREFTWPPASAACRVVVRSADAEIVWQAEGTTDARVTLDDAARARLASGEYLWTAECGGARHGPYAFTVTP